MTEASDAPLTLDIRADSSAAFKQAVENSLRSAVLATWRIRASKTASLLIVRRTPRTAPGADAL
jgi:hypothetical protein